MNEQEKVDAIIRERIQRIIISHKSSVLYLADGKRGSALLSRLNRQINGGTCISAETIIIVLKKFPDVSKDWLLFGEGEMRIEDNKPQPMAEYKNIHAGHHNNNNIGSGTQTITMPQQPTMTKEQALAALLEQNKQLIELMK